MKLDSTYLKTPHTKKCPNCQKKVRISSEELKKYLQKVNQPYHLYCKKCRPYIIESRQIISIEQGFLVLKEKKNPIDYH